MKNYANLFFRSSVSILQSRIINAKCGLFLCVNLLLFIYCPTLKAQVKNDNFLTNVDEKNTVLSASQRTKFDKIKQSKTYESTQIVKIGNIRSLEKERVLPVNLPTQKGVLLAERTF